MKVVWALIFLAGCALLVVAFQAMQQEIDIHRMRKLIILNTEDVKTKEDEILSSKGAMQKLTKELVPLDNQKNQLTKKMEELGKQKESSEQNLNTCRTQKAMQQEIDIHRMRKLIILNTEDVKTKEDEILSSKGAMQKLTKELVPLDNQKNQLTKKMEELGKQKESSEQNLNTCRTQKTDAEQKKTERTSAINTLKTNQNAEIQKVQEEIQSLQKQILDRDTKICSYVDKEREEGRTLCEDKMAASKQ